VRRSDRGSVELEVRDAEMEALRLAGGQRAAEGDRHLRRRVGKGRAAAKRRHGDNRGERAECSCESVHQKSLGSPSVRRRRSSIARAGALRLAHSGDYRAAVASLLVKPFHERRHLEPGWRLTFTWK